MSNLSDLLVLLALGAMVGLWMKLSTARERAVRIARAQCLQHGLQLLDETVGLRRLRWRRINGLQRLERCYEFEVSVDGHDREPGRLWMIGHALSSLSLPVIEHVADTAVAASGAADHAAAGNVVAFPVRRRTPDRLH